MTKLFDGWTDDQKKEWYKKNICIDQNGKGASIDGLVSDGKDKLDEFLGFIKEQNK